MGRLAGIRCFRLRGLLCHLGPVVAYEKIFGTLVRPPSALRSAELSGLFPRADDPDAKQRITQTFPTADAVTDFETASDRTRAIKAQISFA
jgi:hypothetical protein